MRSIFRLSQPAYQQRRGGPTDDLQGVAAAIPQMPTLTPGAAGTLNLQAPSPELGIGILQERMQQDAERQRQEEEQRRWNVSHISDLARVARYGMPQQGAPGGAPRVNPFQVPKGLESVKDPLKAAMEVYQQAMDETYGDHQQATEKMRFFLENNAQHKTQMSEAQHRGVIQADLGLAGKKLDAEQARWAAQLAHERQQQAQQGAFDLRQGARLFNQKRNLEHADLERTLEDAKKRNALEIEQARALQQIKDAAGPGIPLEDALKLQEHVTKHVVENLGWDAAKIQANPQGYQAAIRDETAKRLAAARGTQKATAPRVAKQSGSRKGPVL